MMQKIDNSTKLTMLICLVLLVISGCSGGGGGNAAEEVVVDEAGFINISITDAPVDTVIEVWVEFDGISLKPQSADTLDFAFEEPLRIDLLALTGENTSSLLENQSVPAGGYNWIRLDVNADLDTVFDSYVMTENGEMVELEVTSQRGLQLVSGFTITSGQTASFVIDWDLRKGLTMPKGQGMGWKLRPALRITDLVESGSISGVVEEGLLSADSCTNDLAEDTGNSVYVFSGHDATLEDIHTEETDPVSTAAVTQDENGFYVYSATFLSAGDYTVAFTCQGLDDDPETDDTLEFSPSQNVSVIADEDTIADF
ncbi:MAG: DUF4382 domain-containing protein [Proteobacteria bacterium]|nr:DUF4382 domain-containing protein [Pseudomonadota bacterium]